MKVHIEMRDKELQEARDVSAVQKEIETKDEKIDELQKHIKH